MTPTLRNNLRHQRRKSQLTQRELARLMGYRHAGPILRHEHSRATPPLAVAVGYEIVFRVPVAQIFTELREVLARDIEARLADLEASLGDHSARERNAKVIAQKLLWLAQRKTQILPTIHSDDV